MKKSKIEKRVLDLLKSSPVKGLKTKEIAKRLQINSDEEYSELKALLHSLYSSGKFNRKGKRYTLLHDQNEIAGILEITRYGYGFVVPKLDGLEDIYISERNLGTAFHGDNVMVELFARNRKRRPEGAIVKVTQRIKEEFVGTLHKSKKFNFVVPDDKFIHRDIYVSSDKLNEAEPGDKVVVRLIEWTSPALNPIGDVVEILGKAGDNRTEMLSIAKSFNLRTKFPDIVEREASAFSQKIIEKEIPNRLDLRDKTIFTIDPEDAKDFDDALSIEEIDNKTFLVGVHIADVSFFVREGSELDNEALLRGTSVYLVNQVIPMLPEALSNNWCSLMPGEDRLCYSVLIKMNDKADALSYELKKTVINNKRRFTYEEVQQIIETKRGDCAKEILQLNELARLLLKKRIKDGGIDFVTDEVKFKMSTDGQPLEIIKKIRLQSHRLVEDFMLLANKLVAQKGNFYADKKSFPFVYRIHDVPDEVKIKELSDFVKTLGYKLNVIGGVKSRALQKLLDQVRGKPEEILINEVMIRSMAKAEYSDQNIGHYGLAFKDYSHFTSPIRRYPDLITHRLLFMYEGGCKLKEVQKYKKELPAICKQNSASERLAMEAERESIKKKQIEYIKDHLGKEYDGIISGVQSFGLFVELNEILVEGLVHIKNLPSDIYFYDEKKYSLFGRIERTSYRLGDKIRVRVIDVDEERNEIDFELVD
jgi:ribonuclease R